MNQQSETQETRKGSRDRVRMHLTKAQAELMGALEELELLREVSPALRVAYAYTSQYVGLALNYIELGLIVMRKRKTRPVTGEGAEVPEREHDDLPEVV